MKQKWIFVLLATLFVVTINAQRLVALHGASGTQFFDGTHSFEDACNAAVSGDTLYLSGGTMAGNFPIQKKLFIYGAGHYPNATTATDPTKVDGYIQLDDGASGSKIEGVNFLGHLKFKNNGSVNNVTIKRCKIDGYVWATGTSTNHCQNNVFIENVITRLYSVKNLRNSDFFNNIILRADDLESLNFINNIFLFSDPDHVYYFVIAAANNCLFKNNIFIQESDSVCNGEGSSTWEYNIFCTDTTNPDLGNSTQINNNYFMNRSNVFVNQSGNDFSYAHDYHLQSGAASHLGDDNTQTGIYGGFYPWKTESVPIIPHIVSENISNNSDSSGNLHINVNVQAQDD